jgi:NTE family protein
MIGSSDREPGDLGLVLSGGGALAAYQVGLLLHLTERFPDLCAPVITGVSAGAVNAASLAALPGNFAQRVTALEQAWCQLSPDAVYDVNPLHLWSRVLRFGLRLVSGRSKVVDRPRSLLDTAPLRAFLQQLFGGPDGLARGIDANLATGQIRALAITASSYSTGSSVTWVDDRGTQTWRRAHRSSRAVEMTVDHIMASTALPIVFPAIEVDGEWFGDGGMGLTAPFSPAIHLGARRLLCISTRSLTAAAPPPTRPPYPPPAQIAGAVLNSLFLEHSQGDALRVERINQLIAAAPEASRLGLRRVDTLMLHPSVDLGGLATAYEPRLPRTLRFLMRGLGTGEAKGNQLLSLLMFQPDYLRALIDVGRRDAAARGDEIAAFIRRCSP